jgi:hypothetical protein
MVAAPEDPYELFAYPLQLAKQRESEGYAVLDPDEGLAAKWQEACERWSVAACLFSVLESDWNCSLSTFLRSARTRHTTGRVMLQSVGSSSGTPGSSSRTSTGVHPLDILAFIVLTRPSVRISERSGAVDRPSTSRDPYTSPRTVIGKIIASDPEFTELSVSRSLPLSLLQNALQPWFCRLFETGCTPSLHPSIPSKSAGTTSCTQRTSSGTGCSVGKTRSLKDSSDISIPTPFFARAATDGLPSSTATMQCVLTTRNKNRRAN